MREVSSCGGGEVETWGLRSLLVEGCLVKTMAYMDFNSGAPMALSQTQACNLTLNPSQQLFQAAFAIPVELMKLDSMWPTTTNTGLKLKPR